jgi:signal transduction histidine kinase
MTTHMPLETAVKSELLPAAEARLPLLRRLNTKLLLLTIGFVLLAEILIFVPSIANFRLNWLQGRLNTAATVSSLLFDEKIAPTQPLVKSDILMALGVKAIIIRAEGRSEIAIMNEMPDEIDARTNLNTVTAFQSIMEAFQTFAHGGTRTIMFTGTVGLKDRSVDVVVDEAPLLHDMWVYSRNVAVLSLLISIITAALVFLALGRLVLSPVRRMANAMSAFAVAPENRANIIAPSNRADELGTAERNLAAMQGALTDALGERKHLANLGLAVSKINHDMRNLLTSAQLISDRLASAKDPMVARLAPKLVGALDRAVRYSENVLAYGKAIEATPQLKSVDLNAAIDDVIAMLQADTSGRHAIDQRITIENHVAVGTFVSADADQLFRALFNLARNASQALAQNADNQKQKQPLIRFEALCDKSTSGRTTIIRVTDNGPGLPPRAREHLFQPFTGSTTSGGTGLGLAIAREIAEGHGGELRLAETGAGKTVFELTLPA